MLKKLGSIRNLVLLATLTVAAVGLVLSYFIATVIEESAQENRTQAKMEYLASAIRSTLTEPDAKVLLNSIAEANEDTYGIVVQKGGQTFFISSPKLPPGKEISVSQNIGPYHITVYSMIGSLTSVSTEITVVSAVLALLIILAGLMTGTLLTRSLRGPIGEVVTAAEKIASGDLSARISPGGPEEIAKLARAFDFMAQHLEESEETKRRFLSDLAHEIATPLNSISGFALALSDGTITDSREREEVVQIIEMETKRVRSLLEDLRNLDTLDMLYRKTTEEINVRSYLEELALRLKPQASEKRATIRVESPAKLNLVTDKHLLDMVMQNFLTNAIRYIGSKEGLIVLYGNERGQQEVVIGVRDNGIGIAKEHLPLIFDRLYRVDSARDRQSGGSGLGLSLAQRAALNLGGKIEVDSKVGEGSDFRLILPKEIGFKRRKREAKVITTSEHATNHSNTQNRTGLSSDMESH
jgi:signal transduction histidine kinase